MSCENNCNDAGSLFTEQDSTSAGGPPMNCTGVEKCINDRLNTVDPKCIATVNNWKAMNVAQKFQALINAQCQVVPPTITPVTTSQSIQSPANSASGLFVMNTFNGAILSPSVPILFTQQSGPNTIPTTSLITATTSPSTGVYNITWNITPAWGNPSFAGVYIFKITARDSNNQPVTGTINITYTAPAVYDTILTFVSSNYDFKEGVSGAISSPNNIVKLEFNKILNPVGIYMVMNISVSSTLVMIVNFRPEYNGMPFRFTHSTGVQYNGTFGNDVNFS